jgi:hypothetical protein
MTIGASIALIIIGAILKWGVTWKPAHLDLGVIGIVLMCGGVIGLLIGLIMFTMQRSRPVSGTDMQEEERQHTDPPSPPSPTGP